MTATDTVSPPAAAPNPESPDEMRLRLEQLGAELRAVEAENKTLRLMLEKVIANRQQSHCELVMLLTNLVSKLPINDVGVIVSKLVEHSSSVSHFLAGLVKGTSEFASPEPALLRTLDQAKRDLLAAVEPAVRDLIDLDAPLEAPLLRQLAQDPESFFAPRMARARRCFVKGQVPRERVVRAFGEAGLAFFNDMTTDPKLNARPKPDEIVLAFKPEFDALLAASSLSPDQKKELAAWHQQVHLSKAASPQARAQKVAFQKLTFILELLHYYNHTNTEPADVVYAQRLPAAVEQLVATGTSDKLEIALVQHAESLLAFVVNPDHRQMIINNIGKAGGASRTLKFILRLRNDKVPDLESVVPDLVRHLIPPPPQKPPPAETLAEVLALAPTDGQRFVLKSMMSTDRMRKDEAEALVRQTCQVLGLKGLLEDAKTTAVSPDVERQLAWGKIKDMIARRAEPGQVAAAIRERLHLKYDGEEMKQSWITLTEADPIAVIRIFCQLPYLPNGSTDAIARTVMETYVTRLTHEKYAAVYNKILTSLKNMFRAKPDSPTLMNFVALVRWVSPEAAARICADVGLAPH